MFTIQFRKKGSFHVLMMAGACFALMQGAFTYAAGDDAKPCSDAQVKNSKKAQAKADAFAKKYLDLKCESVLTPEDAASVGKTVAEAASGHAVVVRNTRGYAESLFKGKKKTEFLACADVVIGFDDSSTVVAKLSCAGEQVAQNNKKNSLEHPCESKSQREKAEKIQGDALAEFEKNKCLEVKDINDKPVFGNNVDEVARKAMVFVYTGSLAEELLNKNEDHGKYKKCIEFLAKYNKSKIQESNVACSDHQKKNESGRNGVKAGGHEKGVADAPDGGGGTGASGTERAPADVSCSSDCGGGSGGGGRSKDVAPPSDPT